MYSYGNLKNISDKELTDCFNQAFADYPLPFHLTEEELKARLRASCVDKELSYGAFFNGNLIGFILNSYNIYNDKKVVFDVATGIVPEHRGKKIFTQLFSFEEKELLKYDIEGYYLETLQQNHRAISAYKNQGFSITREFEVLKLSAPTFENNNLKVEYMRLEDFDFSIAKYCNYIQPSYEHSNNILKINSTLYEVAYRKQDNKITAFCIFSKGNGNILQIWYEDINELKIVIQSLISNFNNIVVKNIDTKYSQVLELFYSLGFVEVVKQFEMFKTVI